MWDDNFSAAVDWALALATLVPVLASSGFVRDPRWIFQVLEVEVVVVGGGEGLGGGQFSRHLLLPAAQHEQAPEEGEIGALRSVLTVPSQIGLFGVARLTLLSGTPSSHYNGSVSPSGRSFA